MMPDATPKKNKKGEPQITRITLIKWGNGVMGRWGDGEVGKDIA